MCKFWSALIDRKEKVWWSKDSSSHEELVTESGWKDDKLEDRGFVRIEISPKNHMAIFSKTPSDWAFKVDEEKTLPLWFSANQKKMEALCWKEWNKAMKATLWKLRLKEVKKFIDEIPNIPYMKCNGKIRKEWHVSYGTNICAAWDAARDAAGNAAWDAAWDAARDAAGNAARDAAGNAAWYAAWDATLLVGVILCPKIAKKHRIYAEKRMDVWMQGYGVRCDVNGKLYVYGLKNEG